jgi:hypothetical protein
MKISAIQLGVDDMKRLTILALACLAFSGLSACTRTVTRTEEAPKVVTQVIQPPGVVEYIWEEPMVDVIDVPPGLDPEGHYYRPAHQEVVEIRQGRWRYIHKPEDKVE